MVVESGRGVIVFIEPERNFGFIDPDDHTGDVVFIVSPGNEHLRVGDHVTYDLTRMPDVTQGGKHALHIRRLGFATSSAPEPVADEAATPEG